MPPMSRRGAWLLPLVIAIGCRDSSTPNAPAKAGVAPAVLPLLTEAPTTNDITFVPRTPPVAVPSGPNPGLPDPLADYLNRGFGELDSRPGDAYVTRVIDDSTPPPPGANAKRLVR